MKKIFRAITAYLKDWKNLLVHAIIGASILAAAFFIPVKPIYRVLILVIVVAFNVARMRLAKKKKISAESPASDQR